MRKFALKLGLVSALAAMVVSLPPLSRIIFSKVHVGEILKLDSWQRIMFIGDSRIGCTFVEDKKYENCVVWNSAMPHQWVAIWLQEMEKYGVMKDLDLVVVNFGPQSFCEQKSRLMKNACRRMWPFIVQHYDNIPLGASEIAGVCIQSVFAEDNLKAKLVQQDTKPITERTSGEIRSMLDGAIDLHFVGIDDECVMCVDWESSLKSALNEICDVCHRNGVQLVFFTAPLTSYYVDAIPQEVNEKMKEFMDLIMNRGVPYYDFREWGEDDDFRDCFHFRLHGAKKFTEWFYKEIIPKYR